MLLLLLNGGGAASAPARCPLGFLGCLGLELSPHVNV